MARRVLHRLLGSLAAILGASIIAFVLLRVVNANPARLILGQFATQDAVDQLTRQLGLDDPLPQQYLHYISSFVRGDWGYSYSLGQPVRDALGSRFPATLELGLYAFLFAVVGAIVLAVTATYRQRPGVDRAVRGVGYVGLGLPQFWLGLMLLVVFSSQLGILPGPEGRLSPDVTAPRSITGLYTVDALLHGDLATFGNAVVHLILPAIALGLTSLAFLTRLLRANLLEVSREPYLLVARSTGVRRFTAFVRHALPNAFLPTLTASGLLLGQLLAGSVLVETVFRWPGVGALVTDGVDKQDYAVVQTFILLAATAYVLVSLVVDLLSSALDPRLRESEDEA